MAILTFAVPAASIPNIALLNLSNNRLKNLKVCPTFFMAKLCHSASCPGRRVLTAEPGVKYDKLTRPRSLPHKPLHSLLLRLQDLDNLATLPKLQNLSLLENEVTKQPNYR